MAGLKIYVGCALTNLPVGEGERLECLLIDLKHGLRNRSYEVLEFLGLKAGTASDVYHHDHDCVDECDIFVAICDCPSIGLGMEFERAILKEKQVLAFAHKDSRITRMVIGAGEVEERVTFERYTTPEDILRHIERVAPIVGGTTR